jgi:hypothetical protein
MKKTTCIQAARLLKKEAIHSGKSPGWRFILRTPSHPAKSPHPQGLETVVFVLRPRSQLPAGDTPRRRQPRCPTGFLVTA